MTAVCRRPRASTGSSGNVAGSALVAAAGCSARAAGGNFFISLAEVTGLSVPGV